MSLVVFMKVLDFAEKYNLFSTKSLEETLNIYNKINNTNYRLSYE